MAIKKPAGGGGQAPPGCTPIDGGAFSDDYPVLWDYLSCGEYDDKSRRELSSLVLFLDEDAWKACLNDRDLSRVCFASGNSLEEVLGALEGMLATGSADWRRGGGKGQKKGK